MFGNLVESGSHARDFKRRGSFFIGTLVFYGVIMTAAGVGSIYAYNVRLDERDDLELLALMSFTPQQPRAEPERQEAPRAAGAAREQNFVRRPEASVITPYNLNREVASATTREVSPKVPVEIGRDDGRDYVASVGPATGPSLGVHTGTSKVGPIVTDDGEVAPPVKTPPKQATPQQDKPREVVRLASHIIASKAIQKPVPAYPVIAQQMKVRGAVTVQILIDEQGRVISAQATSGHALLQKAAADAALKARFTPTILSGQPVKISGVIIYNFTLN